jgi:hypothetical protein
MKAKNRTPARPAAKTAKMRIIEPPPKHRAAIRMQTTEDTTPDPILERRTPPDHECHFTLTIINVYKK